MPLRGICSALKGAVYASLRSAWVLARNRPVAALSLAVLLLIVMAALLADVVSTHDPLAQDIDQRLRPPGAGHFFGTDGFGRDIFSRVVHGARGALSVGLLAVGMAAVAGYL